MFSFKLVLFIIFVDGCVEVARGCWGPPADYGGGWGPPPSRPTTERTRATTKQIMDKNMAAAWGGFKPSKKVQAKWKKLFEDFKKKQMLLSQENGTKYKNERGPGSGWPDGWQGIGDGHGGDSPPPWSFQPINQGLPEYCYQPPHRGSCHSNIKRWAYNAYTDNCETFNYGGCDGNQNNFDTQTRCKQACMIEPVTGCDMNTNIYIDE